MPNPINRLSSVDNALHLLKLVAERGPVRLSDAADSLGVARSTAHRLLSSLMHHGFVVQDRPNTPYRPGPVLAELGFAVIGRIDLRTVARPALEALREATHETASLLVLERGCVRFIDCVEGRRTVRVGSRTGVLLPATCTAGGKSILAALPTEQLAHHLPDLVLPTPTPHSLRTFDELGAELEEIRRRGYAINREQAEIGISAVGACLRDRIGTPIAALNIAVPSTRMPDDATERRFADELLAAVEDVHRLIEQSGP
jgi:DNA-binding IclR family transcriptional regulator